MEETKDVKLETTTEVTKEDNLETKVDSELEEDNVQQSDATLEDIEEGLVELDLTNEDLSLSKSANTNTYDDSSIKSLSPADRVRKRPGVMFGTNGLQGAFHTVKEIIGNSLDEARAGFGTEIDVTKHIDGSISVRDYGRGVPMGWNESEGRYNWDLIFNELYAGGKYEDEGTDDSVYEESVGLNGLGVASSQYTSEYMNVISYRDVIIKKDFKRGIPLGEYDDLDTEENTTGETGTYIRWKVDNTVFTNTNITFKMIVKYCEGQAHLEGVTFNLYDEAKNESIVIEGKSIAEYLKEKVGDSATAILSKTERVKGVEKREDDEGITTEKKYSARCNIALILSEETDTVQTYFHNSAEMTIGVHSEAFNDAVSKFFKAIGKENDVNINSYDYKNYLNIIVSSYSNSDVISYANQTKTGVSNRFIYDLIFKTVLDILEEANSKGLKAMSTLIDNVVSSAYARKKAKELEAQIKAIGKATKGKKPKKLVDCDEKNPKKREIFIVEGDSAKIACKVARDEHTQAILPIKGKIINCLKSTLDKVLDNDEIKELIGAFGCGIEVKGTDIAMFNENNLNYNNIIICTDADVDGFQIRVLLFLFFYRFMPTLLKQNKVFVAETPLFEIEINNKESLFAYTVEEKDKILVDLESEGKKYKKINRSKGLGENNPDMLWHTTMNPETRKLTPLQVNVTEPMVRAVVTMLFGNDPNKERKQFIFSMLEDGLEDIFDTVNAYESIDSMVSDEEDDEELEDELILI